MSIDVGIKNLSFVMFEPKTETSSTDDSGPITILKDKDEKLLWNILDITPQEFNHVCSYINKFKKKCTKQSVIKCQNSDESYCALHRKHYNTKQPSVCFDRNKIPLDDVYRTLVLRLDTLFAENPGVTEKIKTVIIEKQPPNNPRMKAIMSVIHSYFVIRGKVDFFKGLRLNDIFLIDAKHKLSVYKDAPIDASHLKKKYDQRKYLSICYTKHFVKDNMSYTAHFENFDTKKDDLADCYLQARYFIEKVYKKKSITQNNMLQFYKSIDIQKTKKSLIYSDKKISKAKNINLYTLKNLIASKNINKDNIHLSPYKKLVDNCCRKYFGSVDILWTL